MPFSTRTRTRRAGSVIVLVAGCLLLFLIAAAYAIDLSAGRQTEQQAQAAADAGALAAADSIPADNTSMSVSAVTTAGLNMAATNDPGGTPTVTMPTATTARVTVNATNQNTLAGLFGSSGTRVSASATAAATTTGGTPGAIFGSDNGGLLCLSPGVSFLLGGVTVNGNVTSNGSISSILSAGTINGSVSYRCGALSLFNGIGVTGTVTQAASVQPFPLDYQAVYPDPCNDPPAGVTVTKTNATTIGTAGLPNVQSGIVCSSSPVQIIGSALSGKWTIIAPSITVLVAATNLAPAAPGLPQFWATGPAGLLGGGNIALAAATLSGGTVYAPNGTISVTLAGATVTGYLESKDVDISVANVTVNPVTGGTPVAALTRYSRRRRSGQHPTIVRWLPSPYGRSQPHVVAGVST